MRLLQRIVAGVVLTCGLVGLAAAQSDYPNRPLRWIVSYPPGGSTDVTARLMGQWLSQRLGQQVLIENRAGGGNNIGTEAAVRAAPDGYTIFLVNPANAINATLYPKLPFNFLDDLVPVGGIIRVPNVMTVTKNFPAKTVGEFIEYAKKNPGKVNMASSGAGTSVHLSGELFKSMAGIDMKHIPYKGAGPATTDLIGGQVDVIFDNMPSIITHIRAGTVRALGVTTAQRSPVLPDTQTVAESVPGYEASAWFGAAAPKGTPAYAIERLNREINAALADPGMRAKLADLGGVPIPGTPEQFWALHRMETEKWAKIVQFSGAKAE
ncbi:MULTISPECIES: Bug family tripartite tricarboxylate transporter substrate binding protein [Ramlibacter]|jgi:tripartite-type tricarboxylate transporter receptor subunit TctC|uniref:Tripartite tricarboxylate transporter substrate binding protein n=1 Tax=Ramlibacter pinisoli TaxID=2682844 RepID=A0A6N8IQF2_9BURK|nr:MULTISPECIES: tripartite tricarboxylate transporter substrate binding protein [Ramlibacter]MBA2963103.1 tripartite tricarboxylate transporter substrate binding protein [Ramlibacter sp. CGMCC 1.13660]MVQ28073.1 tripartite tricarboxylate transporter substrate binding protein [Ramlibacter pinisoli]